MPVVQTEITPKQRAAYKMQVVSFNVQQLMNAKGKTQKGFADYMGVKPAAISLKISRANWKFDEVLLAAEFLDVTVDELADDTIMRMMIGNDAAEDMLLDANSKNAAVADMRPRHSQGAPAGIRTPDTLIKSQLL